MRIGLLNNLRAGRNVHGVHRMLDLLVDHPRVVHLETSRAGAVPEALSELARRNVELLVVNGGDGTLQHVLTALLAHGAFEGRLPLLAPLRGGRTNMTALDLGARRDPVRGMAELLTAARRGQLEPRLVERPVLRVESGLREVTHGMFFGAGSIQRAIEQVHRVFPRGRAQGVFGATLTTAALLLRAACGRAGRGILRPDKIQLRLDGEEMAGGEFTLAMATTLGRLFAGLRPFWGDGPGAVRFTSVLSGAEGFGQAAARILTRRASGRTGEERGYLSRNVDRAELVTGSGFTVDGELVGPRRERLLSISAEERVTFVRA